MKRDVFYEQPEIKFRGEYIVSALTTNPNKPIVCTTLPEIYAETKNYDNCTAVKVYVCLRKIDFTLILLLFLFYVNVCI